MNISKLIFVFSLSLSIGSTRGHLRGWRALSSSATNPRRITCPVVGMLIKNGDLVPSIDSAGLPFITKKQAKLAMLKRGISMEIATKSTDGNFKSDDCPTCPETINPFEMNIIKDGKSRDNEAGKPHEHFRSTGIRDNDAERPDKDLYAEAEKRLFGGNKWMQWSPAKVRDLANLFDRSPGKCKKGVAKSQHLLCSNDQADNIAPQTFAGSLQNMIKEFHDPSTGLITQDKFRAMWLNNEFPSYTACEDQKLADGTAWFDARSPRFNCAWYAEDPDRCSTRAGSARAGFTASTACCACGGGADEELDFEPAPFRSLSIDEAEANENRNARCRDGFYKKYQTDELGGDVDSAHLSWPDADHSLDKCKTLCANEPRCKAISWCDNGDCCSLYNKACDHPWEGSNGHVSLRKKCNTPKATPASTPKATPAPVSRVECDTSAGEVYMKKASPGKVSSLDACKKSCEAAVGCQSITFFRSGWCSLFSTPCTKTKRNNKAKGSLF